MSRSLLAQAIVVAACAVALGYVAASSHPGEDRTPPAELTSLSSISGDLPPITNRGDLIGVESCATKPSAACPPGASAACAEGAATACDLDAAACPPGKNTLLSMAPDGTACTPGSAAAIAGIRAGKNASPPGRLLAFADEAKATVPARARLRDPLPSWNEGPAKSAIMSLVAAVTKEGGPDFVPPADRIATFDNDGTLWCEQPMYVQAVFARERVRALTEKNPELLDRAAYRAIVNDDRQALAAVGQGGLIDVVTSAHAGMTNEEFEKLAREWLAQAKHPRFKCAYTELVYQPMLEVMAYLDKNGFKIFIVTGGGVDFVRSWSPRVYQVPPERVVGSGLKARYELRDGEPVVMRLPTIDFIDDGPGKAIGIERYIGKRPIIAFGNSDGDYEMLRYTTAAKGRRLGLFVHHTDAEREYAYDRGSAIGKLERGLNEATERGWVLIDMKEEWNCVFPFEKKVAEAAIERPGSTATQSVGKGPE